MPVRTSTQGYVEIITFPHYGEKGVPTGQKKTVCVDGVETTKAELIMINCIHGEQRVWITRNDIE